MSNFSQEIHLSTSLLYTPSIQIQYELPMPQLIAKVKKSKKNSDMENFIWNQYEERLAILKTKNIKICG